MKQALAIFDIDGTIFRENLHFELINQLVLMSVFPRNIRNKLTSLYSNWLEHEGTYEQYRKALVSLYNENIENVSTTTVKIASQKMIAFHQKRTYIFAEKLIKHLKDKNYYIIAVSGSPLETVLEYNKVHLHFNEVFGTVYEEVNGQYTGRELKTPVLNKGKFVKKFMIINGFEKKILMELEILNRMLVF